MNIIEKGIPVVAASPGTVTISNANPAVIGATAHALAANTPVYFTCSSSSGDGLPAGLVANKIYYVLAGTTLTTNSFTVSPAIGGIPVATTSAGQGTFTCDCTFEVVRIDVEHFTSLGLYATNSGANAFTLFDIYGSFIKDTGDESGTTIDVKMNSLATDYTTPVYPLLKASGSPVTLAAAAGAWLLFDVSAFHTISIRVKTAAAATKVDIQGIAKSNFAFF